jgi:hypothetical protein
MLEKEKALEKIMQNTFKKDINKKEYWDDLKEEKAELSIRNYMLNEGNNCVFLSNFIKNVAIRWNKDFHILKFETTNEKREVEAS